MASFSHSFLLLSLALFVPSSLQYKLYDYEHVCDDTRNITLSTKITLFSFCNKSLPYATRAKNLIDSMTLAEKAKQLGNNAEGIERLGIPKYNWWSEALHGVSDTGGGSTFNDDVVKGATSFPTPITTGAAFNQSLWKAIGQATSTEARAMHNLGVGALTYWSPNINLVRDPRWGRNIETPGEDPFMVGTYAANFVRGLQDVEGAEVPEDLNTRPLKVSACCKHYAAYDIDYWRTFGGRGLTVERKKYSANVTERDMVESFLRPFEMCVKDGDVSSVMCSYNNVNGVPTCADARLLRGTIRGDWNLHGYIVSDCDAVKAIVKDQRFLDDTPEEAVAQTLQAGIDLECGNFYPKFLEATVKKGLIKESEVDNALFNNYMVLLRLGWFDGMPQYQSLDAANICTDEHIELAASAARQGIVLLKNKDSVLPLSPDKFKKIAVVGPHANATKDMIGNYAGVPCRYVSPVDGFKKYAQVDYKPGCLDVKCYNDTNIWPAVRVVREAEATVIVVGLNLQYEAEGRDRTDFELPHYQNDLIKYVTRVSKGPVVLVVLSAGPVNIGPHIESDDVDAIIWAGYPGQEGGQAIADIVCGKYNPGGRLPFTWYFSDYVWKLPMTSMQFRPNEELGYPGRTYKFFQGSVRFPYGHGLSYTTFTYKVVSTQKNVVKELRSGQHCQSLRYNESKNAKVPPPSCAAALVSDLDCTNHDIAVEVEVTNAGKVDGSDVVMLYARVPYGIVGAPIKQLAGFQRVFLEAGATEKVKFELSSCRSLLFVTESAYEVVPTGEHSFLVGSEEFPFVVDVKKVK